SPLSKAQDELEKLNALQQAGLINDNQRALAVAGLAKQFDNLGDSIRSPQALIEGSAAAFSAITQAGNAGSDNPSERIKAAIDRQTDIQRLQLEEARKVSDALADGFIRQAV